MSEPTLTRAWAMPLALAVLSVAGLVIALLYDGVIDVVAVTFVVVPLAVIVRQLARRTATPASPPATRIP